MGSLNLPPDLMPGSATGTPGRIIPDSPEILAIRKESQEFMQKVYAWMSLGLIVSGFTAFTVAGNPDYSNFIIYNRLIFFSLLIGELLLVYGLVSLIKIISANIAIILFLIYCFTSGLTLSVIFLVYSVGSIGQVFFITAGTFGLMSTYGYFTKKDLTVMGQILFMGLIGLVLASITNFFTGNSQVDFALSIIGVIIFTGLTAYDTQKIKDTNLIGNAGTDEDKKESIIGALTLYLDFINLFLKLLRLLGKKR